MKQELELAEFETDGDEPKFVFGARAAAVGAVRFTAVRYHSETETDFWNDRDTDGIVATADPVNLESSSATFIAGDVGKELVISGSAISNAQGGNNNGRFLIATVIDPNEVTLVGPSHDGLSVETATPLRLFAPAGHPFVFPDDLGKKIVISDSGLGNDGTYVIDKLLNEDTLDDLEDDASQLRTTTTVAEVVGATFVSELDLTWHLLPVFETETLLAWELSDAGSMAGTALTLRRAVPDFGLIVEVQTSQVQSAQLLEDATIDNEVIATDPEILYEYYPFYLADALGIVRLFLSQLTAAGIIPDFELL